MPAGAVWHLGTKHLRHGDAVLQLWFTQTGEVVSLGVPGPVYPGFPALARRWSVGEGQERGNFLLCTLFTPDYGRAISYRFPLVPSPDQGLLAGIVPGQIHVLDANTGKRVFQHAEYACAVGFAPKGRVLRALTARGHVRQWDLTTGRPLPTLFELPDRRKDDVLAFDKAAFSPDGCMLVIQAQGQTTIRLWDLALRKERWKRDSGETVETITFSSDSRSLLLRHSYKGIWVWEAATARQVLHRPDDCAVFASPDGKLLLTCLPGAGDDRTATKPGSVHLRDSRTGNSLREFPLPRPGYVNCLAASADGKWLGAGLGGEVVLWDRSTGKLVGLPQSGVVPYYTRVLYSANSRELYVGSDRERLSVREVATGKEVRHLPGREPYARTGGLLALSTIQVAGGASEEVTEVLRVCEARSGKVVSNLPVGGPVKASFTPGSKGLIVSTLDSGLLLFDAQTGRPLSPAWQHLSHDRCGSEYALSGDGRMLATDSLADASVLLIEVKSARLLRRLVIPGSSWHVPRTFSPDGSLLATSNGDDLVLWNVANGRIVRQFKGAACHFSPDGNYLLVKQGLEKGATLCLQDVASGKVLRQVRGEWVEASPSLFSADVRFLVLREGDKGLRLEEVSTGVTFCRFQGDQLLIEQVAYAPDGRTLASVCGKRGTLLVWDVTRLGVRTQRVQGNFSTTAFQQLWKDLASMHGPTARRAYWQLVAAGDAVVPHLRAVLPVAKATDLKQARQCILQLESKSYSQRLQASQQLMRCEDLLPFLQQQLAGNPSLETRQRLEKVMAGIRDLSALPDRVRATRTIGVLEAIGTSQAHTALKSLAQGALGFRVTAESGAALKRAQQRKNKGEEN